jgi:hypothetical protein
MNTPKNRWKRWIAPAVLGLGLTLNPTFAPPACAQDAADASGEKGRPFDGYIATCALVMLALFLVGKSARR